MLLAMTAFFRYLSYIICSLCIWTILSLWSVFATSAIEEAGENFPLGDGTAAEDNADAVDFWTLIKEDAIDPTDSVSEKIQEELGVAYTQAEDQRATFYIQELLNWFLAIIGLISLIVLVYGFYKMFVAKDNAEAFQEALSIVKWAIIALLVIWVSRYIVSIMFDLFFAAKEDIE